MTKPKRPSAKAYAETVKAYKKEIECLKTELFDEIRRRKTAHLEELKLRQQIGEERGKVEQTEIWWRESIIRREEAEKLIWAMLKEKYLPKSPIMAIPSALEIEKLKYGEPGTIISTWTRTEKGDKDE